MKPLDTPTIPILVRKLQYFIVFLIVLCCDTTYLAASVNDYGTGKKSALQDDRGTFWTISGYVFLGSGTSTPFKNVTLTFSGLGSTTTNANGYYQFDVPNNWSGTVVPSYCGTNYEFQPEFRSYLNVKKHFTQQNFNGFQINSFTISGVFTHTHTGAPLANTQVNFANGMSVTTNENGFYSITVEPCWSDTLRPVSTTWNFSPVYRFYPPVTENQVNQNFNYIQKSFGLPPGWNFVNTGTVHIISVFTSSNPNVCGVPLQQGDYIGVFYRGTDGQLYCGGAGEWTGLSNTPVFINADDPYTPQKDGFTQGEMMNWKVYTWTTTQQEYTAYPTYMTGGYLVGDNKFYSGGLSIVTALNAYHTQQIPIPAGWGGLSGYVTPPPRPAYLSGTQIQFLMSPIQSNLVILQSLNAMYFPSQNINSLANWNVNTGYKIKVTQNVVLDLPGCPLTNRSQSIPSGWSILPVKSECDVNTQQLFASIINRVNMVKEVAGNKVFWPALGINTLPVLQSGNAYMVSLTQASTVTFPPCNTIKTSETGQNAIIINKTPWNTPVTSPSSHTIAITSEALNGLAIGDFIGAFTPEGICAGLTEIQNIHENALLTIFGNDPLETGKTGFNEGEPIQLKLFRTSSGETVDLIAEYDQNMASSDGKYMQDGISVIVMLMTTTTGTNGMTYPIQPVVYPNPTTGPVHVILPEGNYHITLVDITGNTIFDQFACQRTRMDLSNHNTGIYLMKISNDHSTLTRRIVLY